MSAASRDDPQSHPPGSTDNWPPCGADADFAGDRLVAAACRFGGRAKFHNAVRRWRRRAAEFSASPQAKSPLSIAIVQTV